MCFSKKLDFEAEVGLKPRGSDRDVGIPSGVLTCDATAVLLATHVMKAWQVPEHNDRIGMHSIPVAITKMNHLHITFMYASGQ